MEASRVIGLTSVSHHACGSIQSPEWTKSPGRVRRAPRSQAFSAAAPNVSLPAGSRLRGETRRDEAEEGGDEAEADTQATERSATQGTRQLLFFLRRRTHVRLVCATNPFLRACMCACARTHTRLCIWQTIKQASAAGLLKPHNPGLFIFGP